MTKKETHRIIVLLRPKVVDGVSYNLQAVKDGVAVRVRVNDAARLCYTKGARELEEGEKLSKFKVRPGGGEKPEAE